MKSWVQSLEQSKYSVNVNSHFIWKIWYKVIVCVCVCVYTHIYRYMYQLCIILIRHKISLRTVSMNISSLLATTTFQQPVSQRDTQGQGETSDTWKAAEGAEGRRAPHWEPEDSMTPASPSDLSKFEFLHPANEDTIDFHRGLRKDSIKHHHIWHCLWMNFAKYSVSFFHGFC